MQLIIMVDHGRQLYKRELIQRDSVRHIHVDIFSAYDQCIDESCR